MAKLTSRSRTVTTRFNPETLVAAELVARLTGRTVSSLIEYALILYMRKNYPAAFTPGATVTVKLEEAP